MPIGDSITIGVGCGPSNAYRKHLGDLAATGDYEIQYVGSQPYGGTGYGDGTEAYPGQRIDELMGFVAGKITTYQPEVALLYVGMNDCIQDYDFSNIATRYRALIDQILGEKADTIVMLAKINPSSDTGVNARITSLDSQLAAIAADYPGAIVLDANTQFNTATQLNDAWHPNCYGYQQVGADLYFTGLEQYLENR